MLTVYILILCLSAALATWSSLRAARRIESLLGISNLPAGLFCILSTIGFFVIVAAPARVIVGAIALLALGWLLPRRTLKPHIKFGLPILAIALGASSLPYVSLGGLPALALIALLGCAWLLITFSAQALPEDSAHGTIGFAAILLPLATAPFYTHTPDSVALDAALILCPLLAASLVPHASRALGLVCLLPTAYLLGWLMSFTVAHGGIIPAGISLIVLLLVCAYGMSHRHANQA